MLLLTHRLSAQLFPGADMSQTGRAAADRGTYLLEKETCEGVQ